MTELVIFVLDATRGTPAQDIPVTLKSLGEDNDWYIVAAGETDEVGCLKNFLPDNRQLSAGHYCLHYATREYFITQEITGLYPEINVHFFLGDEQRLVLPLLITANGYTTYRGS